MAPSPMGSESKVASSQVPLVLHHGRAAARRLTTLRRELLVPVGCRVPEGLVLRVEVRPPGHARRQPVQLGVLRRPVLDIVLVPIHADRLRPVGSVASPEPQHAQVPDLVADLSDPGPPARLGVPEVGERGKHDVGRLCPAELAVGLAHDALVVADVVTGDAVRVGIGAGADRGVRARGDRWERSVDRVAEVGSSVHQPLEGGPGVRPLMQHVPSTAVDHERHHDLGAPGRASRREGQGGAFSLGGGIALGPDQGCRRRRQVGK